MSGRIYEFVQLDVFTQTPLAGNPLAVFTDARGLNDGEMQALAREMNLSETLSFSRAMLPLNLGKERRSASSRSRRNCPLPDIQRSAQRCTCMRRSPIKKDLSRS